jgi:hypothetical protein
LKINGDGSRSKIMTSKRITTGLYEVVAGKRVFEIERFPDGAWMLFEVQKSNREYQDDYRTKADAIRGLVKLLEA